MYLDTSSIIQMDQHLAVWAPILQTISVESISVTNVSLFWLVYKEWDFIIPNSLSIVTEQ